MTYSSSRSSVCRTAVLACVLGFSTVAHAEPPKWPGFLGPGGIASVSEARIPDEFGPDHNVLWKQEVSEGHSSPVIWGNRVFLTGVADSNLIVSCYRRKNGKLLWKREFEMLGKEEFACSGRRRGPTQGQRDHRIASDGALPRRYVGVMR